MDMAPDEEPTLNIPSLLTLAVVSFFVLRWLLSPRDADGSSGSAASSGGGRRVDPAQVDQISQMFPQLDRRDIMWDLQRNGSNVAMTTERILSGRGLETSPPSFQPQIPVSIPVPNVTSQQPEPKPRAEDLISRYNLIEKVKAEETDGTGAGFGVSAGTKQAMWSQSKNERQRLLQKRRDDMILAARRRIVEKDRAVGKV